MSEIERLGIDIPQNRSVNGVGMTRGEMEVYNTFSNPDELLDGAINTDGYKSMNDNERSLSLQLMVDQLQDDAEAEVFNIKNPEFRDLRQRIREAQ